MPTNEWKGNAPAVSEQLTVRILAAIPGAVYQPFPSLPVLHQALATDTPAAIAQSLATQLTAQRLWAAVVASGSTVTLTGYAGIPTTHGRASSLSAVPAARSTVERVRAGILAVSQQTDVTLPSTTTGGTWSLSANFGSGVETASGLAWNITPTALATALNGLATPGSGDVTVELRNSAQEYRITWGGSVAGTAVTVTVDESGLTGNTTVVLRQASAAGSNVPEVQAFYTDGTADPWVLYIGTGSLKATDPQFSFDEFSAANIKEACVALLEVPSADLTVTVAPLAVGTLATVVIGGTSLGRTFPLVKLWAGQFGVGNIVPSFRLLAADGGAKDEVQYVPNGVDTVSGHTTTLTHVYHTYSSVRVATFVRFTGGSGNTNQSLLLNAVAVSDGGPLLNESWTLGTNATGGTLTVAVDGDTTADLAYNASASALKTALEGLTAIGSGNASVTGAGTLSNPWRMEWVGFLAQENVPDPLVDGTDLTGGEPVTQSTIRAAALGVNELQAITVDRRATGGTLRAGFQGDLTTALAYDASASTWQTALQALSTLGSGNCTVSGTAARLLIEFTGSLAARPHDLLTLQDSLLVIAPLTVLDVRVVRTATGPEHWNNAANWTLGRAPASGDTVFIRTSPMPIRHGLLQRVTVSIAEDADTFTCPDHDLVMGQTVHAALDDYSATLNGSSVTITANTLLYVVGTAAGSLQLSTSAAGNPLVWTAAATGKVAVRLARLIHHNGTLIGWPRIRVSGEWEPLPRYLAIDFADSTEDAPALEVAAESSRICIDAGASPLRARVLRTGSGGVTNPALQLLVDHASARLDVLDGQVGVAVDPDQTAELLTIRCTGGQVILGQVEYQHALQHAPGEILSYRTSHGVNSVVTAQM